MMLTALDAIAKRLSSTAGAQVAVVRALVEEMERHDPSEPYVAELHHQLSEELERLARLVPAHGIDEKPIDVLVVDDDAGSRNAATTILRSLGYPSRTVSGGAEALEAFAREPAAIVLSDWSMPGMSGLDLCLALKERTDPPYVILATAFHESGKLLEGVRGGVDDFLRKPIVLEELEVRLLAGARLVRATRAIAAVLAEP